MEDSEDVTRSREDVMKCYCGAAEKTDVFAQSRPGVRQALSSASVDAPDLRERIGYTS